MAPNMCLGVCPNPALYLVAHGSPNGAIFKYSSDLLRSNKLCQTDNHEQSDTDKKHHCCEMHNGIKLELSSHPGMGIVSSLTTCAQIPLLDGIIACSLGLGPVENAVSGEMNENNHLLIFSNDSKSALTVGAEHNITIGKLVWTSDIVENWSHTFVINKDGTISPSQTQNLILGFQVPGKSFYK
mmetsp:Transcript_3908/g.7442  ORF Transcript_3908/g.7442 Transcript_3908/m.7442 type:complete len:184 (+) Transcript_3908:2926-3477(+)